MNLYQYNKFSFISDALVSSQDSLNEIQVDPSERQGGLKKKDRSFNALEDLPSESGSQQQLIYENRAYQDEPTPSLSGSEFTASLPEASQDPDVCSSICKKSL